MAKKTDNNKSTKTDLRSAIRSKKVAGVLAVIRNGADVNATWSNGYIEGETALMLASDSGLVEIVEALLKAGADVSKKTSSISGGAGDLTALHYALNPAKKEAGHLDCIRLLLAAGADANAANSNGGTPLALAAKAGWKEAVTLLLEAGARPESGSGSKLPALHCAVLSGNLEILELLLSKGVDFECRNDKGDTALMVALANGKEAIVETLLQKGADVNAVNATGQTPLMRAALFARDTEGERHKTSVRLLKRLLEAGAPLDAKDKEGKTALDYAKDAYEPDAPAFLKAQGAKSGKK